MGIDISKFSNNNDSTTNNNKNEENITEVQQDNFDIVEYTDNKKNELRQSKEVEQLTSLIEVDNPNTILQFGKGASEGISRVSDSLLSNIKMNQNEKNTEMLVRLTKIMDKFDLDDFAQTKEPGFFQKLFKKANSALEVMFQKYDTLGSEVEKIQVELQRYEREIQDSNKQLGAMLNENFNYYNELEKYIVAGEMAIEELDNDLLPQFKAKAESGDQMDLTNYQELLNSQYTNDYIEKLWFNQNDAFQSLYYMNNRFNQDEFIQKINHIFKDQDCGHVMRVKGFYQKEKHWYEINMTQENTSIQEINQGQDVIIVIGEELNKNKIDQYFK